MPLRDTILEMNFEGKPLMNKNHAYATIEAVRAEIGVMGRNDSEFSTLDAIKRQLEDGQITPDDAIAQAKAIPENKQDYN